MQMDYGIQNNRHSLEEWEVLLGEQVQLSDEVLAELALRQNAVRYAAVGSVSLASFVRGVRQV